MAGKLGYRDSGQTSEEGINRVTSRLIPNAGVMGADDLNTAQAGTPDNTVRVAAGDVAIGVDSPSNSRPDYYYHGWFDSEETVTISANSSGNDRIDVVVVYVDLSVVDDTNPDNPGALVVDTVEGTPAATPAAPDDTAIQSGVGAGNPWMMVAQVDVANGFSSITDSNITDLRQRVLSSDYTDVNNDRVISGLEWSQVSGLVGGLSSGVCIIAGKVVGKSYLEKTFTASKDTYIDVASTVKPTSTDDLTYTEVSNGAATPSLAAGSIRVAKVVTNGSGITSISNANGLIAFSAHRTTNQTMTNGNWSRINFQTEDYNYGFNYDSTTNYRFNVPVDGVYHFDAAGQCDAVGTNGTEMALFVDGAEEVSTGQFAFAASNDDHAAISADLYLTSGQYVDVRFRQTSGSDRQLLGSSPTRNYFTGHLVGRVG